MIEVRNIRAKGYVRGGVHHESTFDSRSVYHADIVPGRSIRIFGTYGNHVNGPQVFDKRFRIGDSAEYDSYNLKYNGRIVAIGPKTVTIKHYESSDRVSRLDLHTFCWRNWDFDAQKSAAYNADEMQYL